MLDQEHIDHPKQFGFKKNSSCQHAVWTVKQGIEFCKRNGKWAYVCAIDASKAFDKVNRTLLWKELIESQISPYTILSFIGYYKDSFMLVKNGEEFSSLFRTLVGVRQGGKASPKLFSIYIEKILRKISESKEGLNFGKTKLDIIAYADDLLLISSSKKELQDLLDIVTESGRELEIKFNSSKTIYILFNYKTKRLVSEQRKDCWQGELRLDGELINLDTLG